MWSKHIYIYIWAYFKSTFLLLRDISLAFLVSSIGFSTYFDMKNDVYGPIDGRTLEKDRTEKSLTVWLWDAFEILLRRDRINLISTLPHTLN